MVTVNNKSNRTTSNEANKSRCASRQRRCFIPAFCALVGAAFYMPAAACAQQSDQKPVVAPAPAAAAPSPENAPSADALREGTWDAVLGLGIRPDKPKGFTRASVAQLVRTVLFGAAADYARLPLLNYHFKGGAEKRLSINMNVSRRDTSTLAFNLRF